MIKMTEKLHQFVEDKFSTRSPRAGIFGMESVAGKSGQLFIKNNKLVAVVLKSNKSDLRHAFLENRDWSARSWMVRFLYISLTHTIPVKI